MALRTTPITAQLARLSIGPSSTTPITVTYISIRTKTTKGVKTSKGPQPVYPFPEGHGEKIYIFHHFLEGHTVYMSEPVINATRALRQIPFNGKKLKPSKIRKDMWRPLAMIQFEPKQGEVGRSVFQRLRECKKLHQLSWGDEAQHFYNPITPLEGKKLRRHGRNLTLEERGRVLNNQKLNTIADMAAVLAGLGKGSRMWLPVKNPQHPNFRLVDPTSVREIELPSRKRTGEDDDGKRHVALAKATIFWDDQLDMNYAKAWSSNVTHATFSDAVLEPLLQEEASKKELRDRDEGGEEGPVVERATEEEVADKARQEIPAEAIAEQDEANKKVGQQAPPEIIAEQESANKEKMDVPKQPGHDPKL
ncbi:hypothetical protein F4780DRAFT_778123 [Xylariomycetidae sp. FL0641]|nr:hypothetical protein F4780DRAFT_778123 [Xylariomycetidae sp. FL0641]